ncbi:MAG: 2Fe-2S iron-sulfur cluster binding domain-containing protein [Rhodanobacteraceae bacterium]|nr:2Fe-2S iron-sulfur cluster binding domain-containing protein [Rhodanobacteraceae bacterium]
MPGIEFNGRHYGCQPGETLLEALLRQGADTAHSCRRGSCRCCQLRLVDGEVETRIEIDPSVRDSGHLLPCVSLPRGDVKLAPADPSRQAHPVDLIDRRALSADIVELDLAPSRSLDFRPGQHIELIRADGLTRPYSIVSLPDEDWYFRVHVRRDPAGAMSRWLCDEARPGERLHLRGAHGACHYRADMCARPLLLLAGGSGAGALAGIARHALAQGHPGPIELWHGVRTRWELYLHDALLDLQRQYPQFRYRPCLSREQIGGIAHGYPGELAFASERDCSGHEIFLCGPPAMVVAARAAAIGAGAQRARIHADPFLPTHAAPPRDAAIIDAIPAEPALWEALERGPKLTRLLQAFYRRVYADPRLAPFFVHTSIDRAIQKQYEFLVDLISGTRKYFGLNPFNAHHWMVIDDELFDYREALFEGVLREHDFPEPLIRRWMALHERFRGEIVKAAPRGMWTGGRELPVRSHSVERLDIDTVCDRCGAEIRAGQPSRYQHLAGQLHCAGCAGLA